ncbi:MAG: DUF4154 domain-containing protein [Bacteroidales bacterium]|nr:DUF4154 domain-containing protein [Bacteroidales bacterium]
MNRYFFLIIFIILLNNYYLVAQQYSDAEVKTAYIYNFGKFVKWENEQDIDTFRIGLYGKDTTIFFNIKKMVKIRLLKEKPISIFHFTELKNISDVHILYVNNENNFEIAEIFKKIQGNNTLLITDQCKEQKSVMINFLSIEEGSIPFEINKKNITDENLILSPEILVIGGTEIDVRELYKVKEKELQTEKEKVEQREIEIKKQKEKLYELSTNIKEKIEEINKQQSFISEQNGEIEEQKNKLIKLLGEISEKQNKLDSKINILKKQETEITSKQNEINKQKQEIKVQSNILKSQEKERIIQKNNIENQKAILNEQLEKIKIQKLFLYLFIVFIALILGLVFFIYHGYKIKKEANKKLREKSNAITKQNALIHKQNEEIRAQTEHLEIVNKELEKLSIVASETDNAVMIMDAKGNFEWVNEGFTRIYGYNYEQLIKDKGKNIIEGSANPNVINAVNTCLKDKKTIVYETITTSKFGEKIWAQTTLTPILDGNNNVTKLVAIDTDISAIKKVEEQLREQKDEITDSIRYAKRIQTAILELDKNIKQYLHKYFIINEPRDIVSGDFYWVSEKNGNIIIAVADCTGHGVPGAFMSMLGVAFLNEIMNNIETQANKVLQPNKILNQLREKIITSLHQKEIDSTTTDGMDISLCIINYKKMELQFSGANNPAYLVRENKLKEIYADKMPIGIYANDNQPFAAQHIKLIKNDMLYLLSDGYTDQFGGNKGRKFMLWRLKEILQSNSNLPLPEQKKHLVKIHREWKGNNEQVDDILIMGIKI